MLPSDLGFPSLAFPSYRPHQEEISLLLSSSSKRFSLLSAPTGSGKSLIYMTIAALLQARVLILVSTKALADQLMSDFKSIGLFDIRGHSNYSCAATFYSTDNDLLDFECGGGGDRCQYRPAVAKAMDSQSVVTNYANHLSIGKSEDSNRLGEFDLLILDEAHDAHSHLVDHLSIKLSKQSIRSILGSSTITLPLHSAPISDWHTWATSTRDKCRDYYTRLSAMKSRDGTTSREVSKEISRVARLGKDLARFINRPPSSEWTTSQDKLITTLSTVWGSAYSERYLFRGIPRIILVSATITESDTRELGIDKSQYDFHEIPSSFSSARMPFIYVPTFPPVPVQWNMSDGQKSIWVRQIDEIISGRLDRKGIIHTRSYDRARDIISRSQFSCIMTMKLDEYLSSPAPIVLVSPAVDTGYDFRGDMCRYQIISKVPLLDKRIPIIKARCKSDPTYHDRAVTRSIEQAHGRATRSEDDWSETFIVDATWAWFRKSAERYFNRWFFKCCKQLRGIPQVINF